MNGYLGTWLGSSEGQWFGYTPSQPVQQVNPLLYGGGGTGFINGTRSYKDYGRKRVNPHHSQNQAIIEFVITFTSKYL